MSTIDRDQPVFEIVSDEQVEDTNVVKYGERLRAHLTGMGVSPDVVGDAVRILHEAMSVAYDDGAAAVAHCFGH